MHTNFDVRLSVACIHLPLACSRV